METRKKILKYWMESYPRSDNGNQWEGYKKEKTALTEDARKEALLSISQARYKNSRIDNLDEVFSMNLRPLIEGKDLLEIGSNHGGASLYYYENYKPKSICGIDTTDSQAQISELFFKKMGVSSGFRFQKAFAEKLPFSSGSFDVILSFDVFEHVADVKQTLNECYRVLRSPGNALIVFPSYYNPIAHHLGVTRAFFVHWFYSPETLIEVSSEIINERNGYRRIEKGLEPWEKLPGINGLTLRAFRKYAQHQPWQKRTYIPRPFFSDGQMVKRHPWLKLLKYFFLIGSKIPLLSECCNRRIVYILEK